MKRLCNKNSEVGTTCEIADKTGRTTTYVELGSSTDETPSEKRLQTLKMGVKRKEGRRMKIE
jgi:hypothetical protein